MGLGVNGLREWKGPRVASRDPREIKKQSLHKAKGLLEQYAREALMAKS